MRKISKVVLILGAICLLNGCEINFPKVEEDSDKFEIKMPEINLSDVFNGKPACDKSDSEQGISGDVAQETMVLKDTIETQDFEEVNCQGEVTKKGRGPVRIFEESVKIDPPMKFEQSVDEIEVSNARTCGKVRFDSSQKEFANHYFTQGTQSGKILLSIWLSDHLGLNLLTPLSMREQKNLLKVSYYHCVRRVEDPETKVSECAEFSLLGGKEVVIDIQIDRPEIAGLRTVQESCPVAR